MSYSESKASCDWCRDSIYDNEYVACQKCHEKQEQRISDLEREIESIHEAISEQGMKLIDVSESGPKLIFVVGNKK